MARETDYRQEKVRNVNFFEEGRIGGEMGRGPLCLCSPQLSSAKLTAASPSHFLQLNIRAKTSQLRIRLRAQCCFLLPKRVGLLGCFSPPPPLLSLCASVDAVCDLIMLAVFLGLCVSGAADRGKNSFSVYEMNPPHTHVNIYSPSMQSSPVQPGLN